MPGLDQLTDFAAWGAKHVTGDETGEAQIFLNHLFKAFGPAGGLKEAGDTLEWRGTSPQTGPRELVTSPVSRPASSTRSDWLPKRRGSLADHLAVVLPARYAALVAGWVGEMNDEFRRRMRALRALCQDIVELRRGDHGAERLRLRSGPVRRSQQGHPAPAVVSLDQGGSAVAGRKQALLAQSLPQHSATNFLFRLLRICASPIPSFPNWAWAS